MKAVTVGRAIGLATITATGLAIQLSPAPARSSGGVLVIVAPRIESAATVGAPAIVTPAVVSPTPIGSNGIVRAPRVDVGGVIVSPAAISSASTASAPTLSIAGAATIAPPPLAPAAATRAPSVSVGGVAVAPASIGPASAVWQAVVSAAPAGSIQPSPIAGSATAPAPSVGAGGVTVAVAAVLTSASIAPPAVSAGGVGVTVPIIAGAGQTPAPTVAAGAVVIAPAAVAAASATLAPSAAAGEVRIAPAAIVSAAATSSPSVSAGPVAVTPPALAAVTIVRSPSISVGGANIAPGLLASAALVRPPSINSGTLNPVILTIGDSWITQGQPPYSGFYTGYYFQQNPGLTVVNMAKGGEGLQWIRSKLADIVAARPYIIHIDTGRNDFTDGRYTSYAGTEAQNEAAYVEYLRSILADLQTQLPGVRIVLNTLTEQHTGANPGFDSSFNRNRKALNAQVRQWKADGLIARVLDYGADSEIGQDGQFHVGAYTNDALHPSEAASQPGSGHGRIYALYYKPLMDDLIASTPLPGASGDPDVSTFSIGPASISKAEGDSGSTPFVYTVTRTGGLAFPAAIDWAVAGSGANPASASDFIGGAFPTGTLNFAANAATADITINVAGDTAFESDEGFTTMISNGRTFGTITTATAGGAITNDDTAPAELTYTAGPAQRQSPGLGGSTATYSGQSLAAGRLILPVYSDYTRTPETIVVKRSGFADIALTKIFAGSDTGTIWAGDIPTAASDYSIVLTRNANGLLTQVIAPIVIVGAAASAAQVIEQVHGQGTGSPVAMSSTLTKPAGGFAMKVVIATPGGSSGTATVSNNDGGTEVAAVNSGMFDGPTARFSVSVLPATVQPSTAFTPSGNARIVHIALAFAKA